MSWAAAAYNPFCRPDDLSRVPTARRRLDSELGREHIRIKVAGRTDNPWRQVLSLTSRRPGLTFLYVRTWPPAPLCCAAAAAISTAAIDVSTAC